MTLYPARAAGCSADLRTLSRIWDLQRLSARSRDTEPHPWPRKSGQLTQFSCCHGQGSPGSVLGLLWILGFWVPPHVGDQSRGHGENSRPSCGGFSGPWLSIAGLSRFRDISQMSFVAVNRSGLRSQAERRWTGVT